MLFSALGGMLRVGAVVLTAGALGSGVYFLVQAGDSQELIRASRPLPGLPPQWRPQATSRRPVTSPARWT